jgi:hypothetical protein
MPDEITTEQVQELMDMLTGEGLPEGMIMSNQPKLNTGSAFSIIWFLQEHLGVIPDNFEKCSVCNRIYDSYSEGYDTCDPDGIELEEEDCYQAWGVTREILNKNAGKFFCSFECESHFWTNHAER